MTTDDNPPAIGRSWAAAALVMFCWGTGADVDATGVSGQLANFGLRWPDRAQIPCPWRRSGTQGRLCPCPRRRHPSGPVATHRTCSCFVGIEDRLALPSGADTQDVGLSAPSRRTVRPSSLSTASSTRYTPRQVSQEKPCPCRWASIFTYCCHPVPCRRRWLPPPPRARHKTWLIVRWCTAAYTFPDGGDLGDLPSWCRWRR